MKYINFLDQFTATVAFHKCTIADRCRVISELLCIKFKFLNMPLLSCEEIDCGISCLCTD